MAHLTPPRRYHPSIKFLAGFLGTLAVIFFLVVDVIRDYLTSELAVLVNVSELGPAGIGQTFPLDVDRCVELVLMGPVHALLFYGVARYLIHRAFPRELEPGPVPSPASGTGGTGKVAMNPRGTSSPGFPRHGSRVAGILEVCAVACACVLCMGHAFHLWFDRANALYRTSHDGYAATDAFLFLYHADEWLGHAIIHCTYFSCVVVGLAIECAAGTRLARKMAVDEILVTVVLGGVFGVVNAEAARQGESALPLLILSMGLLAVITPLAALKRWNPLHRPILLACLVGSVIVVAWNLVVVAQHGLLPYYPYIR